MALYEFATGLGYPHPDIMLDALTARQTYQLMGFINMRNSRQRRQKVAKSESSMEAFFANYEKNYG